MTQEKPGKSEENLEKLKNQDYLEKTQGKFLENQSTQRKLRKIFYPSSQLVDIITMFGL